LTDRTASPPHSLERHRIHGRDRNAPHRSRLPSPFDSVWTCRPRREVSAPRRGAPSAGTRHNPAARRGHSDRCSRDCAGRPPIRLPPRGDTSGSPRGILGDALAPQVQGSEIVLRPRIPAIRTEAIPACRLAGVLRHPDALGMDASDPILSEIVPLNGGGTEQPHRFRGVPLHAAPVEVQHPEIDHGHRVALVSGCFEPECRRLRVRGHAKPVIVMNAKIAAGATAELNCSSWRNCGAKLLDWIRVRLEIAPAGATAELNCSIGYV